MPQAPGGVVRCRCWSEPRRPPTPRSTPTLCGRFPRPPPRPPRPARARRHPPARERQPNPSPPRALIARWPTLRRPRCLTSTTPSTAPKRRTWRARSTARRRWALVCVGGGGRAARAGGRARGAPTWPPTPFRRPRGRLARGGDRPERGRPDRESTGTGETARIESDAATPPTPPPPSLLSSSAWRWRRAPSPPTAPAPCSPKRRATGPTRARCGRARRPPPRARRPATPPAPSWGSAEGLVAAAAAAAAAAGGTPCSRRRRRSPARGTASRPGAPCSPRPR